MAKKNTGKKENRIMPLILLLIAISLGVVGQLTLKKGISAVGVISVSNLYWGLIPTLLKQPLIVVGFCCYFLSAGLYMIVISQVPLSWAYPLVSIGYVLVVLFSKLLFHEEVTVWRWLGVFMICAGVIMVARTGQLDGAPQDPPAKVLQGSSASR